MPQQLSTREIRRARFDEVLVPTDGSGISWQAVGPALGLVEDGGKIHIVHVAEQGYGYLDAEVADVAWHDIAEGLRHLGEDAVRQIADAIEETGVATETHVVEASDPAEGVLTCARDHDVDAIAMSTHARSGIDRFLLGSVTEEVVRDAEVPVLVVPIGDEAGPT